jgi:hypothetical protein
VVRRGQDEQRFPVQEVPPNSWCLRGRVAKHHGWCVHGRANVAALCHTNCATVFFHASPDKRPDHPSHATPNARADRCTVAVADADAVLGAYSLAVECADTRTDAGTDSTAHTGADQHANDSETIDGPAIVASYKKADDVSA